MSPQPDWLEHTVTVSRGNTQKAHKEMKNPYTATKTQLTRTQRWRKEGRDGVRQNSVMADVLPYQQSLYKGANQTAVKQQRLADGF